MEPIQRQRQIVEKYGENKRQLCVIFIDLEKAYNKASVERV